MYRTNKSTKNVALSDKKVRERKLCLPVRRINIIEATKANKAESFESKQLYNFICRLEVEIYSNIWYTCVLSDGWAAEVVDICSVSLELIVAQILIRCICVREQ